MEHSHAQGSFRHEALFYAGEHEFVERTTAFVRAGLEADEPVLVMALAPKVRALRADLGVDAARVLWADVAEVGANPARLIPAWRSFVKEHAVAGRWVRGVGEPIWAERTPEELVECQRHETLLNIAFADSPFLSMLCLYDTEALSASVIAEAMRSHPLVIESGIGRESSAYSGDEDAAAPSHRNLSEPPLHAHRSVSRARRWRSCATSLESSRRRPDSAPTAAATSCSR